MRLSELCDFISDQCDPAQSEANVYIGLEHIEPGAFELTRHGASTDVRSSKNRFQKGDLLYGKLRPYLDKAVLADGEGICSTDVLVLRPKPDVCGPYILGLIHSPQFLTHAISTTHGVNHPRTSWAALSNFEWDVPEKATQKKIAAVLWKVQGMIRAEEKLIASAHALKQSAMHQLFTRGLRDEPSNVTDVGKVPESWLPTTLGEICAPEPGRIQTGPFGSQLHASDYQSSGVPVINPTHLDGNRINHENVPKVSGDTAARLQRHMVEVGDILFGRRGEIGRHGLVGDAEKGWLCGTGCFLVRVRHSSIDNAFLSRFFSTDGVVAWLNTNAAGAIMPNLNNVVLSKLPIFYPKNVDQQREIASILQTIDAKISTHERKRGALREILKTLLHQLMTGQICVDKIHIDTSDVEPAN